MATVKFTEPITLPAPPQIVAAGKVKFQRSPAMNVTLDPPCPDPYIVLTQGDGDAAGALHLSSAIFAVTGCSPGGFTIKSTSTQDTQNVSYLVVRL